MRVVLDTNVLVAAFIAHGACADVLERVLAEHELVASLHLRSELEHVLIEKLKLSEARVARAVRLIDEYASWLEPPALEHPVCRDPEDDPVLALAMASGAACLVTGDDDLLTLGEFVGIPILSPRGFLGSL